MWQIMAWKFYMQKVERVWKDTLSTVSTEVFLLENKIFVIPSVTRKKHQFTLSLSKTSELFAKFLLFRSHPNRSISNEGFLLAFCR